MNQPIKPGWKTSEFWMALVAALMPILILYGVIGQAEASAWLQFASVLVPSIVSAAYSASRGKVKSNVPPLPHDALMAVPPVSADFGNRTPPLPE